MSLDADAIVDRRRMRRKLTFWRVSALLIALLALVGLAAALVPANRLLVPGNYIARIKVQGLIRGNQDRVVGRHHDCRPAGGCRDQDGHQPLRTGLVLRRGGLVEDG